MSILMYYKREEGCQRAEGWGYILVVECLPSVHETPGQSSVAEEEKDSEH